MPEGRNIVQGIGTNFSPELEVEAVVDDGLVGLVLAVLLVEEEALESLPLYEMTAKSIRPEPGFTMISSIFPRESPCDDLTSEFINLLARTSC